MHIYTEEDGAKRRWYEIFQRRHGFFGPSPAVVDALIRARLRARDAEARAGVSLGPPIDRRDLAELQSGGLSPVYESATELADATLSGSTVGTGEAPLQEILYSSLRPVLPGPFKTGGTRMALDLGNIITSLGEAYIRTRWGGGTTGTTTVGMNGNGRDTLNGVGTDQVPRQTRVVAPLIAGLVGPWGFRLGSSASKIAAYLGALVAGGGLALTVDEIAAISKDLSKVKCKRRRRRLASLSDIKDLAALSAVLGKGKLLETWVATRRI